MTLLLAVFAADADQRNVDTETPVTADVIIVVGAGGEEKYATMFADWSKNWQAACKLGKASDRTIGPTAETRKTTDRDLLKQELDKQADESRSQRPLWVVLIGHGTFDGKAAKLNLRGPDVTASDLAEWLKPITRPVAIINSASASGPFVNKLSGPNRVVVTSTKSGYEMNFARFGEYMSKSITDPTADLDKDGQTSLLEGYLSAARATREFYQTGGRLETEHPLIDDNGDTQGTPAGWFRGVRPNRKSASGAAPDGLRAHQFHLVQSREEERLPTEMKAKRDALEFEVVKLRSRKATFSADEYYKQLEVLLVELAGVYETND
ncbi:MAG: hypothetical protein CMJ78_07785 [Planctomycetaceae bacterium]|nr:hypothetical protein [Planctomycetaceae bacterium]